MSTVLYVSRFQKCSILSLNMCSHSTDILEAYIYLRTNSNSRDRTQYYLKIELVYYVTDTVVSQERFVSSRNFI
jgi:hypothetical protein